MRSRAVQAFVVLAVAALLAACGYTTRALVPDRYRTIAVPVFTNESRRRDLHVELTRVLVEEIQSRTHLRVVGSNDDPDLVLRGSLADIDEETLSRRDRQVIREGAYFVTARVDVQDRRANQPLVRDRKVTERESFVPVLGEDVRTARSEAMRSLAEKIVRTLESAW